MTLILGGAYQGKLTYAIEQYHLTEEDIFTCTDSGEVDCAKRCIRHLEEYVLHCVRQGKEPTLELRSDAIVICRDVSCGVVPMEADLRAWREATGRLLNRLTGEADHVVRLFCGLPQVLK